MKCKVDLWVLSALWLFLQLQLPLSLWALFEAPMLVEFQLTIRAVLIGFQRKEKKMGFICYRTKILLLVTLCLSLLGFREGDNLHELKALMAKYQQAVEQSIKEQMDEGRDVREIQRVDVRIGKVPLEELLDWASIRKKALSAFYLDLIKKPEEVQNRYLKFHINPQLICYGQGEEWAQYVSNLAESLTVTFPQLKKPKTLEGQVVRELLNTVGSAFEKQQTASSDEIKEQLLAFFDGAKTFHVCEIEWEYDVLLGGRVRLLTPEGGGAVLYVYEQNQDANYLEDPYYN